MAINTILSTGYYFSIDGGVAYQNDKQMDVTVNGTLFTFRPFGALVNDSDNSLLYLLVPKNGKFIDNTINKLDTIGKQIYIKVVSLSSAIPVVPIIEKHYTGVIQRVILSKHNITLVVGNKIISNTNFTNA